MVCGVDLNGFAYRGFAPKENSSSEFVPFQMVNRRSPKKTTEVAPMPAPEESSLVQSVPIRRRESGITAQVCLLLLQILALAGS
eukprot:m.75882 g.75882  ORF g.75882 m.75882 type:complete len:84 (+) comp12526_c0_seq3:773-1024(+)